MEPHVSIPYSTVVILSLKLLFLLIYGNVSCTQSLDSFITRTFLSPINSLIIEALRCGNVPLRLRAFCRCQASKLFFVLGSLGGYGFEDGEQSQHLGKSWWWMASFDSS